MHVVLDAGGRVVARSRSAEGAHRASRRRGRAGAVELNRAAGDAEKIAEIEGYVEKYLGILGATELRRPRIVLRSNLGSRWLARDVWSMRDPQTSTMEVQRSVLGDAGTLERVVAHETIHHVDSVHNGPEDLQFVRLGLYDGHGRRFLEMAERINAATSPCYVTATSDAEYVQDATCRPYLLMIVPIRDRFGYAWSVRLSPQGAEELQKQIDRMGARAVHVTDPRWTIGAKIKKYGGVSVPKGDEDQVALRALYDSVAERVAARTG